MSTNATKPASPVNPADIVRQASVNRSQARLAAVQALYQMDLAATDLNTVIAEFERHRFGAGGEDDATAGADAAMFSDLVRGVVARQKEIDPLLDGQLAAGWRLDRIDSILRALMRAAVYEFLAKERVPARVVLNEYVEIAKAFFEGDEPKVANAVLDKLAKKLRAGEFGGAAG